MANDLNQCNFIGRLGRDPETRFMPDGTQVTTFSIAVGWKGRDKEGVEWINITAFSKLAEICAEYLVKASQVFISGRMKTEQYEKDGVTRYSTKVIADRMQMLGSKTEGATSRQTPRTPQASASGSVNNSPDTARPSGSFDDMEDDIPF